MLEKLKKEVCEENIELFHSGIVKYTWGNVSAVDREYEMMVIKPSGVNYSVLTPEDMVVVSLKTGERVEGVWKPSSDTLTHLRLYNAFPDIGGIAHTHSRWATIFAQAGKEIPAYGTTHGDCFYGNIPCTRVLTREEIETQYEVETGNVIVEAFKYHNLDYKQIPAVLVNRHGPFSWGEDCHSAVYHAIVLEEVACMAYHTKMIDNNVICVERELLDKHYFRKHGDGAYYGQNGKKINVK